MLLILTFFMFADDPIVYGAELNDSTPEITITELMANPEKYRDKMVKVKGTVIDVCAKRGCWMDLKDDTSQVRIKVKDGEIVFGDVLKGKTVLAEGTVYKFDLTQEQAVSYYAHQAEEKGITFDPATVTKGLTIYQIGGLGAEVIN